MTGASDRDDSGAVGPIDQSKGLELSQDFRCLGFSGKLLRRSRDRLHRSLAIFCCKRLPSE
jgi:hypothetical protein